LGFLSQVPIVQITVLEGWKTFAEISFFGVRGLLFSRRWLLAAFFFEQSRHSASQLAVSGFRPFAAM